MRSILEQKAGSPDIRMVEEDNSACRVFCVCHPNAHDLINPRTNVYTTRPRSGKPSCQDLASSTDNIGGPAHLRRKQPASSLK